MDTKLKQDQLERIQTTFSIDKAATKELPEGEFEAILSTEALDRHGERVSIKGMAVPKRTIRMYFNHLKWGEVLPIGTWTRIWKTRDGQLMGHGKIDLVDEFEQKIAAKIKLGTLDSISIGFVPKEYDVDTDTWTKSELSEASVVNEPANTEALVTNKSEYQELDDSLKVKLKRLEQVEVDDADPPEEENPPVIEVGDDDTEIKAAVEELKSKVGALEAAAKAADDSQSVKSIIKVRMAGKEVDKAAENLNAIVKVKLKENQ